MTVQVADFSFLVGSGDSVSKTVSGLAFQPQAYRLHVVGLMGSDGVITGDIRVGDGMTDGTRHYAQAFSAGDGLAASGSRRNAWTDSVLGAIDYVGNLTLRFTHGSFNSDGFTLSTQNTPTGTYLVKGRAFAGFDNIYVDAFALPTGTLPYAVPRTAPNFQPDFIYCMSAGITTPGTAQTNGFLSRGWAIASGTQVAIAQRETTGATDNYCHGGIATDAVVYVCDHTGTTLTPTLDFDSMDSQGYTLTRTKGTGANYIAVMCFKGGVWKAGTTVAASGAGNHSPIATTGCNPVSVEIMASNIQTASQTSPFEGPNLSLGAASGSDQWAINHHSANRETTTGSQLTECYTRSAGDRLWIHNDRAGVDSFTATGEISLSSFGTEEFTLNQNDGDPTAVLLAWVAVGNAPGAGPSGHGPLLAGERNRLLLT